MSFSCRQCGQHRNSKGFCGSITSLLFIVFVFVGLFALHPGCPANVRSWLFGSDKPDPFCLWKRWQWQVPPKNWRARLGFFLSAGVSFALLGVYCIYKTSPNIAWGFAVMSFIMALNFSVLAIRLIAKVLSCYFLEKNT